ncbi:universal stress protein [uncultured Vibrio sp.]|uniref:universal stress protein n=1 Tax=uncultured Vibrio sp. TaxID=114054 RepID=UPI0026224124|nr:universal stress protein [uncultured Vibrio sp.]
MEYRHILVAIELAEESKALIDRANFFADKLDAHISFVYIDVSHGEIYPEIYDIQQQHDHLPINDKALEQLREFEAYTDHPIKHIFAGTGDLDDKINEVINTNGIDLLLCGHHHDFWHKLISQTKQIIDASPIDILVVPME